MTPNNSTPVTESPLPVVDPQNSAVAQNVQVNPQNSNSSFVTVDVLDKIMDRLNTLFTAVIIVLFVGYAGIFVAVMSPIIDAWRFRASTYEELVKKVSEQSAKVDLLYQQLTSQKKDP